ncbi:MAG: hypothetical protein ACJ71W_21940 [Terriglobales bacterium]
MTSVATKLPYEEFLRAKVIKQKELGFELPPSAVHKLLKPHQRDMVLWALRKGRGALFASFGLGKTMVQLEIADQVVRKHSALSTQHSAKAKGAPRRRGGAESLHVASGKSGKKQGSVEPARFLIVAPLGVRQEFKRDAEKLGIKITFVRRIKECKESGIYLTNYETIRDGKMDPKGFIGVSLDEASVLRGRGNKTFGEFAFKHFRDTRYKYVATATPSPNEYQELLSYSAFLDVMDISAARTRFFKRNSTKMDALTLHPHKEREFWLWLSTWAVFVQKPSDLGYSDDGYVLPDLDVRWHEVQTQEFTAKDAEDAKENKGKSQNRWTQQKLMRGENISMVGAAREKRNSLALRIAKMMELRAEDPGAHRILWHDLEDERRAIENATRIAGAGSKANGMGAVSVYGSQDLTEREDIIVKFSDGRIQELAAKPVIAGSGCNFQRHCAWAIFLGIGWKFNDFIQAIHRIHRFLQTKRVRIDLIYTDAERDIRAALEEKWQRHKELTANMSAIIRQYGLATNALQKEMGRVMGVERRELVGERYLLANNDCILETRGMDANSVGMVLTSLPFSTQYEYTPSYHDFGHTEDNEHFFAQMDYLTPELLRVLKPGRVAAIHCKDRIMPGGMTGLGFQTVYAFSDDVRRHFESHGFAFLARKTVVTDVVRENNQTYRLGWTEQCKDGSRMGAGLPEYVLLFRKPPTDSSNGYADEPVRKSKPKCLPLINADDADRKTYHGDTETRRTAGRITAEQFENEFAERAGATVDELRCRGRVIAPCDCGDEDCKGWRSIDKEILASELAYSSSVSPCLRGEDSSVPFDRDLDIIPGTGYSRAKWQLDAHGFTRSDGNRLLCEDEFKRMKWGEIYRLFRKYSFFNQYCFAEHVRLTEALEAAHRLPNDFMLMPPQSWHPDVWTDVTRMRTLNGAQHAKGREMHLCPLQFDIVERLITQFTMEGEEVYDPFGGLMTVPYCAVKLRRRGRGCELEPRYFLDGAEYCRAAEEKLATPTLFDLTGPEENTLPLMNADDADLIGTEEEQNLLTTETRRRGGIACGGDEAPEELAADERRLPQITPTPLKHRGTEGAEVRE